MRRPITAIINVTTLAVPEPASMGLLGIGMAGFFAFRRFFDKRADQGLIHDPVRAGCNTPASSRSIEGIMGDRG